MGNVTFNQSIKKITGDCILMDKSEYRMEQMEQLLVVKYVLCKNGLSSEYLDIFNKWQSKRNTTYSGVIISTYESGVYLEGVIDLMRIVYDLRFS
jgi:disulfide oxidoreductase YuzD